MRWLGLVMLVAGCGSVFDLEPVPVVPGGYARTITLTQSTRTELSAFPVSILITGDDALAAHVLDGADVGFTLAGDALPCELVRFDREQGLLDAWVRVPTLPPVPSSLMIDLVYGTTRAPCSAAEMWADPEVAVWHGELDTDRMLDSTSHGHDVVALSTAAAPMQDDGIVGHALRYDGTDDALCEQLDRDGSLAFGATAFSYGLWVNVSETVGQFDMPLYKGGSSMDYPGFDLELGSGGWTANVSDGLHTSALGITFSDAPALDAWHYLVAVVDRDRSSFTAYLDGVPRETGPLGGWGSFTADQDLCVGNDGVWMKGLVDEPRITHAALTDDWILVAYKNLMRRTELVTIGSERPN